MGMHGFDREKRIKGWSAFNRRTGKYGDGCLIKHLDPTAKRSHVVKASEDRG
jgi:hypothetical protein|tara:strand:+ start:592 stop:747 length:156 start_codon:yes stop_codon:yes gene_type:complete